MNNLLWLQDDDFTIEQAQKGNVLCNNQKGIIFTLFHANPDKCQFSTATLPEFKKLALKMPGVKFGLCNLNKHPNVYFKSKDTIAPINNVPYIILYVNGRPLMRYDGEQKVDKMSLFLNDIVNRLNSKKDFFDTKNIKIESDVPNSSTSTQFNVVCDSEKGICYLNSSSAYPSMK